MLVSQEIGSQNLKIVGHLRRGSDRSYGFADIFECGARQYLEERGGSKLLMGQKHFTGRKVTKCVSNKENGELSYSFQRLRVFLGNMGLVKKRGNEGKV